MDQDILEELKNEAIDTVEDRIAAIVDTIDKVKQGLIIESDALATVKLDIHTVKSVAASFEMKPVHVLCHRFEDFVFGLSELQVDILPRLHFFADRLSETLDAWVAGKDIDISKLMRQLPAKGAFDVDSVTVTNIEVMLVMEPGIATKIVTRELMECGYRMVNVASTIDAFELIPAMKPDLVIVSRVMPELSGIDLVCALKAMPSTRATPVAMIASVKEEKIPDLPTNVPVLRKGANFADDVADVFTSLGIL